jgi:MinD-like ATPase involved in chromosome partitioning or flagellar assembly
MAVNRGKPVALAEPGADFSKAIRDLADMIAARTTKPKDAKGQKKSSNEPRQSLMSKLRS